MCRRSRPVRQTVRTAIPSASSSVSRTRSARAPWADRPPCGWFRLLLRHSGFRLGLWIRCRGGIRLGQRGFRFVALTTARILGQRVNLGRIGFGGLCCRQCRHGGHRRNRRSGQLRTADAVRPRRGRAQLPADTEFLQRVVDADGYRLDQVDRQRDRVDVWKQRCLHRNTRAEVASEGRLDQHLDGLVQRRQQKVRHTEAVERSQDRDDAAVDDVVVGVARRTLVDQVVVRRGRFAVQVHIPGEGIGQRQEVERPDGMVGDAVVEEADVLGRRDVAAVRILRTVGRRIAVERDPEERNRAEELVALQNPAVGLAGLANIANPPIGVASGSDGS